MQIIKNAIISCAGMGSRLGLNKTKCLIKIEGKTLLERQLDLLQNFDNVFVIIGFQYMDVINHIDTLKKYKNVIYTFNHDYKNTGTLYSINQVIAHIKNGPTLLLDGDLLIEPKSFNDYINYVEQNQHANSICVTDAKSEEAVFVKFKNNKIFQFSFSNKSDFEWSGIAYVTNSNLLLNNDKKSFVFTQLTNILPANYYKIKCFEIDTTPDLSSIMKQPEYVE